MSAREQEGRLGKRRLAVLRTLDKRGRATAHDVLRLLGPSPAARLGMAEESVRDVLADLETRGLIEPAEPHLDRAGRLRGTWKITSAGREVVPS